MVYNYEAIQFEDIPVVRENFSRKKTAIISKFEQMKVGQSFVVEYRMAHAFRATVNATFGTRTLTFTNKGVEFGKVRVGKIAEGQRKV